MKRPEWLDDLSILGWCFLVAALLLMIALTQIGCESTGPLRVSSVPDPFAGGDVVYFTTEQGDPTLAVWRDGRTCLTAGLEASSCGAQEGFPPREWTIGPPILVARAFLGFSSYPEVGQVISGQVYPATGMDSFTVTGGGFTLTCIASDTLSGVVWLRVPALASCGRDSMVRHLNLTRVEVPE